MTKKSWIDSESVLVRESDIPSVTNPSTELVIASSAPTMLPPVEVSLVRVETVRDEDAASEPSVVPLAGV